MSRVSGVLGLVFILLLVLLLVTYYAGTTQDLTAFQNFFVGSAYALTGRNSSGAVTGYA